MPFSDCMWMTVPGSRNDGASMGMPMPRLTYMPSLSSLAARLTMRSRRRRASSLPMAPSDGDEPFSSRRTSTSARFGTVDWTTRLTLRARRQEGQLVRARSASRKEREDAQDAGEVDLVRVDGADGDDLLGLDDRHLGRASHGAREVLRGVAVRGEEGRASQRLEPEEEEESRRRAEEDAPEDAVAVLVGLPHLDERIVALDRLLHDVALAAKLAHLARLARDLDLLAALLVPDRDLARLHRRAVPGRRVERRDARAAGTAPLGERALRRQLERDLAVEVQALEVLRDEKESQHVGALSEASTR